jgi:hypothetical protein
MNRDIINLEEEIHKIINLYFKEIFVIVPELKDIMVTRFDGGGKNTKIHLFHYLSVFLYHYYVVAFYFNKIAKKEKEVEAIYIKQLSRNYKVTNAALVLISGTILDGDLSNIKSIIKLRLIYGPIQSITKNISVFYGEKYDDETKTHNEKYDLFVNIGNITFEYIKKIMTECQLKQPTELLKGITSRVAKEEDIVIIKRFVKEERGKWLNLDMAKVKEIEDKINDKKSNMSSKTVVSYVFYKFLLKFSFTGGKRRRTYKRRTRIRKSKKRRK